MPPDMTEKLYDIALDPEELSSFIETWNRNGFETGDLQSAVSEIQNFDEVFQSHIVRADRFLQRQTVDDIQSLLSEALDPFDTSIALILDEKLSIAVLNTPASTALGLQDGQGIDDFPLDPKDRIDLIAAVRQVFAKQSGDPVLLSFESPRTERQVIYHIKRLTHKASGAPTAMMPYALIATTDFYRPPILSTTLETVFGLSGAERGIVQALAEGGDVKQVAQTRGTSVETVRSQLRSILGKCKVRSQAELIRMVLSLREVVGKRDPSGDAAPAPNSVPRTDWLEQEVTKPLSTMTTSDGRRMDYLDQGPRDGAPILLSHMGYGHMRFSKPMLKLAYRHGLRVIAPVRAGYGDSDNLKRKDDVLAKTRSDTLELLDLLGIARLPYAVQGNDLLFAVDLVAAHPGRITEIAGICARPNLPGDIHYAHGQLSKVLFVLSEIRAQSALFLNQSRLCLGAENRSRTDDALHQCQRASRFGHAG
jgi:DNA-binding NarL/FixJ family response regulator